MRKQWHVVKMTPAPEEPTDHFEVVPGYEFETENRAKQLALDLNRTATFYVSPVHYYAERIDDANS